MTLSWKKKKKKKKNLTKCQYKAVKTMITLLVFVQATSHL